MKEITKVKMVGEQYHGKKEILGEGWGNDEESKERELLICFTPTPPPQLLSN